MATRRRSSGTRRAPSTRSRRRSGALSLPSLGPGWKISPDVTRSLVGVFLLALGAITLIALALPGEGTLTKWWRDSFAPFFGSGRWLLPFVLLAAGVYVERASTAAGGWQLTLLGAAVAFAAALGLLDIVKPASPFRHGELLIGGYVGGALNSVLSALVTRPGAFIVLAAVLVGGLLIMLDTSLHGLIAPFARGARGVGAALSVPRVGTGDAGTGGPASARGSGAGNGHRPPTPTGVPGARPGSPGQTGIWGGEPDRPIVPSATPSQAQLSGAFAPLPLVSGSATSGAGAPTTAVADRVRGAREPDDVTDAGDSPPTREERAYRLPPPTLLDDVVARASDNGMDHELNSRIIVAKLASFNIPARVLRWNAGPVVTQYEVEPDPSIKVSRIEALSDDLAMALAARTIRIEAPIPGKSVVGLEIPNADFNVVALRRILEDPTYRELQASSHLTFALGRDVAGHARGTDLGRMPHLLIAGATGSGKSVMVNALITSFLMGASPNEVRLILMDLKRVELASYNGLPHLLVPVITEPDRAKAALKWAVGEMEGRYRRFAGSSPPARNIAGYNASRVDPDDRLPYIVIIVDELADLMMREGKNVEEPIVRLAQKARATGIHLVLATQRPSVNVVTGLIKANFPSRIAFAMASQIDSRTILDAPGAEDLIGRGDMLFQPADQPRPMRLQGVFVSDREIANVTEHCRAESEPHYDLAIVESDEGGTSAVDDLAGEDADRLLPDAVEVIREYDRASASLLQRRLKIGYARAARIIDQLEARGYIGAFDGSNARAVLRRDAGPALGGGADRLDDDEG